MPIMASIIAKDVIAKYGKRWVREDHTDDQSVIHESWYAPHEGVDVDKELTTNAAIIGARLDQEVAEKVATEKVALIVEDKLAALTAQELIDAGLTKEQVAIVQKQIDAAIKLEAASDGA